MSVRRCVPGRGPALPVLIVLLALAAPAAFAQEAEPEIEALKKTAPRVYLDCGSCDINYIKTEITFVNYVRDRNEAQIHVMITTLRTGSGGYEYTVSFLGQDDFAGMNDVQTYYAGKLDTDDEVRRGLVKVLKVGLMPYVARTSIASRIALNWTPEDKPAEGPDRWNFWVFSLSASGYFNGESTYKYGSLHFNGSANRVTPDLKVGLSLSAYRSRDKFILEDGTIDSVSESAGFSGLVVKSLSDHWSAGAYVEAESSSYSNLDLSLTVAPAVEFNLFPYAESTRRQLRFLYKLGFSAVRYREETIYLKTSERLWKESLSASLELKEKWGSVSASLEGSHYFHDARKYRLEIFSICSLQLVKGLNAYVLGSASRTRDLLGLPRGGATLEEVLLQRKQLATGYSYFAAVGLSFTFGSVFTNVVNPRFGTVGSGGTSISISN
ncbi:MAG: hypothetical protein JW742_07365 [Candidatus Aminicenantes bacterium]|nr:hypothetical protein [Candidatus Aminicenantes bacterium]